MVMELAPWDLVPFHLCPPPGKTSSLGPSSKPHLFDDGDDGGDDDDDDVEDDAGGGGSDDDDVEDDLRWWWRC